MSFTLDPKARELLDACAQRLSELRYTSVTVSGFLNEYLMRTLPGELERLKRESADGMTPKS